MSSTLLEPSCRVSFLLWYDSILEHSVLLELTNVKIILAIYYTFADIVLLAQCFYYRGFTWKDEPAGPPKTSNSVQGEPNERTGLLAAQRERRGSSDWTALSPAVPHYPDGPTPVTPTALQTIAWNSTIIVMVCAAGILGWFLGERATHGDKEGRNDEEDHLTFNVTGQVFGYLCTVAYIASRLPQLILNYRRKTTDGLSMLFFLFACLGNITYVLSIFAYEPYCRKSGCKPGEAAHTYGRYILVNLSWLAGSLVTLLLDMGVFAQYFMYSRTDEEESNTWSRDEARFPTIEEDSVSSDDDDRPILQRGDSETYR
jgi:solute carrier family 66 (lysosomal lysine-arginine transporter), member 1